MAHETVSKVEIGTDVIAAREAANQLGELLSRVGFGRERILITRHGKPIAMLVPVPDSEAA